MSGRNTLVGWLALVGALAAMPSQAAAKEHAAWSLGPVRVVEAGTTSALPADAEQPFPGGTLVSGHVLEAKVKAKAGAIVPDAPGLVSMMTGCPSAGSILYASRRDEISDPPPAGAGTMMRMGLLG